MSAAHRQCSRAVLAFGLLSAVSLGGCGFHLEDTGTLPAAATMTYIDAANAHTEFYGYLRDALRARGVQVVESRQEAGAVLRILADSTGQRMLSVSAQNIPREFEVFYAVTFSFESEGESPIEAQSLVATRSYTYDETLVLGKSLEETELREALAEDLARQILRRIEANSGRVVAVQ